MLFAVAGIEVAPFFVAFWGLPVYTVAGASLMGIFITSVAGVGFYQTMALFFPDMSVAPDWMLAGFIVLTAIKYLADFLR